MPIRGSLDVVTTTGAMGWVYSSSLKEKLTVQAVLNHAIIGESIANLYRADLLAAGFGDGTCGYSIEFYHEVDPLYLPFIMVKLGDGDVDLPRSTISGYSDFFQVLYRQYPMAGRNRSVFGGLWTDRIDAAAILRARRELGTIAPEPAEAVEFLVRVGLAVVATDAASVHGSDKQQRRDRQVAPAAIQHALETRAVTDVLHAVLEDRPLAIAPCLVGGEEPEMFHQPSGMQALPSPTECVALVVPVSTREVGLEVVRDSHLLPEFTQQGASRWTSRVASDPLQMAEAHGLLDRYVLPPGSVAVIGPGLLYRVTAPADAAARAVVIPNRAAPLSLRTKGAHEQVCANGARIWT